MPQRVLPAFFLLLALLLAPARPAPAQESGMPSEIESKLAELGAVINPPETAKLYTALQETEPYQGVKVTRDLKYGTDERHALDVFAPEQPSAEVVHGVGHERAREASLVVALGAVVEHGACRFECRGRVGQVVGQHLRGVGPSGGG